ncbi:MAG: discoidin domain-containing protein [Prevotella sp.]|jgi:hypothetical protein|nr:discoidin domain-containing protein [Prevotella sp.]
MRKMLKYIYILLVAAAFLSACQKEEDGEEKVSGIAITNINDGGLALGLGGNFQVEVSTFPENAIRGEITYRSSDETVFTVSQAGLITAQAVGEAVITVITQGDIYVSDSKIIKVLPDASVLVQEIIVPSEDITFGLLGENYNLGRNIEIFPSEAENPALEYASSNPSAVSVNENGIVVGCGRGNAVITISSTDGSNIVKTLNVRSEAELSYEGWSVAASSYEPTQGTPDAILVDGPAPFWHNAWKDVTPPSLPHWLLIDMKAETFITDVQVERRGYNNDLRKVIVETSRDGVNYTQAGVMDWGSSAKEDTVRMITFSRQKARYIRLNITESNRQPHASINRVRIYGAIAELHSDPELSSVGWSVSASSYEVTQGTPNSILTDGEAQFWHSKWSGGEASLPHKLVIDMKADFYISETLVERRWRNNDLRKAEVEISLDKVTYTRVGVLNWGGNPKEDDVRFAAFAKQKARYIRLTVTESNKGNNASINRVRVYGTPEQ